MSTRFTITDLRNMIELCNQRLEQHGCLVRVEEFNRNGGYGTEHYPIDSEGTRMHSGSSHIASGSARSVARKTEAWTYQQINKQEETTTKDKTESAIRNAIRTVLADDRFKGAPLDKVGDAFQNVNNNFGIGYRFKHERCKGKTSYGVQKENWFFVFRVNGYSNQFETNVTTNNGATAYAELMAILETLNQLTTV